MSIDVIVFGVVFVVALGSSLAMIFTRSPVHTALFLVVAQVALALAFLLQGAFFVAAVQIIIYAGAIMVLFLFVIMLLGVDRREVIAEPFAAQRPVAAALGVLLAAEISYIAVRGTDLVSASADGEQALLDLNRSPGNVEALARVLFSDYLLPFEFTSALLVAAIVGVMVLARRMENLGDIKQIEGSAPGAESSQVEGRGSDDRAKEDVS
ncbi:MAG: NADH-quinone oxidoreductase subunit J [Actinomycetota bacterium]|nr:NADH-quinone oxidoreductase subunit J [Actinomycetota bacterium]